MQTPAYYRSLTHHLITHRLSYTAPLPCLIVGLTAVLVSRERIRTASSILRRRGSNPYHVSNIRVKRIYSLLAETENSQVPKQLPHRRYSPRSHSAVPSVSVTRIPMETGFSFTLKDPESVYRRSACGGVLPPHRNTGFILHAILVDDEFACCARQINVRCA